MGAAGAGVALAAGVLYEIHENWPKAASLRLGVSAAASSLFDVSCSDAGKSVDECLALISRLGCDAAPS